MCPHILPDEHLCAWIFFDKFAAVVSAIAAILIGASAGVVAAVFAIMSCIPDGVIFHKRNIQFCVSVSVIVFSVVGLAAGVAVLFVVLYLVIMIGKVTGVVIYCIGAGMCDVVKSCARRQQDALAPV